MPPEDRHSGVPGGGGGANVKSGVTAVVADDDVGTVTFATVFASVPRVTLSLESQGAFADDRAFVVGGSVTAADFQWKVLKGHGGSSHSWKIHWIATDAGDP